jgi:hypothetical protein
LVISYFQLVFVFYKPSNHVASLVFQNPDIVLVHYLNVPYPDDNKLVISPSLALWGDKKEWTKEELVSQLRPMCECAHSRHAPYRLAGNVVKGEII